MPINWSDPAWMDTGHLRPHPLSLKIYGDQEDISDLVASIEQHGVLRPLVVTPDGWVISGKRRLAAAHALHLVQVPVVTTSIAEPLEIELFLLEDNRTREKTNEQKAREFIERLRIEQALAAERMQTAGQVGGHTGGRSRSAVENITDGPVDRSEHSVTPDDGDRGVENLPHPYAGKARDLAAAPLGWSGRTAEKAVAVVQYADESGDASLTELMNTRSVNAAFARVKVLTGESPQPPPFDVQITNLWNFPGPTPGLGIEYPGRIPGDILRNLFWYYTHADDLVVDVFAGGAVTMDAVAWWNAQAELWPLRCQSYDIAPAREGIVRNDVTQPPYLPDECQNVGLIFLDPPYWRQKRGEYSADPTNLANLSLEEFHAALVQIVQAGLERLRQDGHLALIIGATQHDSQFIDHTLHISPSVAQLGLDLVQRIIVPYTTQQFSGADVAQARKSRMMLKAYRDLLVWRKIS